MLILCKILKVIAQTLILVAIICVTCYQHSNFFPRVVRDMQMVRFQRPESSVLPCNAQLPSLYDELYAYTESEIIRIDDVQELTSLDSILNRMDEVESTEYGGQRVRFREAIDYYTTAMNFEGNLSQQYKSHPGVSIPPSEYGITRSGAHNDRERYVRDLLIDENILRQELEEKLRDLERQMAALAGDLSGKMDNSGFLERKEANLTQDHVPVTRNKDLYRKILVFLLAESSRARKEVSDNFIENKEYESSTDAPNNENFLFNAIKSAFVN